ncbi:hypothetical protein DFR86_00405 [Acidianus sulfidivorans JP7]|uniref:Uncharacterized protein n=1 Tax=Acidianus sulfidivorans JP7 TaxID=619593 RepID=A0A2U9IJJ9_9CREN|nr:hypothetical protein [Acidianus sulfidivorans]AWR96155.1 hypothetical protein DFR86_00405 [Acidianus sulfidivorans JP7]
MSDSENGRLFENHLMSYINNNPILKESYQTLLNFISSSLVKNNAVQINSTNIIRLKPKHAIFNSHYVLFKLGKILKHTKGTRLKLITGETKDKIISPIANYTPLYSLSLDRILSSIYWGRNNELLKGKFKDVEVVKVKNPLNVEISPLGLTWLKSVEPTELFPYDIALNYVINSLLPPISPLEDLKNIWWEQTYISYTEGYINSNFSISIINKTIAYIKGDEIKILDKDLNWVPLKGCKKHNINSKNAVNAVILVRNIKLGNKEVMRKDECSIYPINIINIANIEQDAVWYTLLSIVVSQLYLSSPNSNIVIRKEEVVNRIENFLSNSKDEGTRRIEDKLGSKYEEEYINILLRKMPTYLIKDDEIYYIHPIFYEMLISLQDSLKSKKISVEKIAEFYQKEFPKYIGKKGMQAVMRIDDAFKNYFSIEIPNINTFLYKLFSVFDEAKNVISFSKLLKRGYLPSTT